MSEVTTWCPECMASAVIEEQSDESHMTPRGEVGYHVLRLACGHSVQGSERVVAPAPGAPYAGPQTAVAATSRPRDLRAAAERQRQLDADPWGSRS